MNWNDGQLERISLTSFLGEVVVNPEARHAFQRDPIGTAEAYGLVLADKQKEILKVVANDLATTGDSLDEKLSSAGLLEGSGQMLGCICNNFKCTALY